MKKTPMKRNLKMMNMMMRKMMRVPQEIEERKNKKINLIIIH
jgi:hypothetical protein